MTSTRTIKDLTRRMAIALTIGLFVVACGNGVSPLTAMRDASPDDPSNWPLASGSGELEVAAPYLVGAGIGDITGPAAGLATAGYAAPAPKTAGIHQRLWARAFVVAERDRTDGRVAVVTVDLCYVTGAVKAAVVEALAERFGPSYGHANVMLTATHTHSGPGGFGHHAMYNVPTNGFSQENFDIIVKGIVEAIAEAHANMRPASIRMTTGTLHGASRNRSLAAFELNDAALRAQLPNAVDESVTMLRMDGEAGRPLGLLHWFATHGTSMNKTNDLISGDNKGYAAWKFEQSMGTNYRESAPFVAAFANSNAGDASPNVAGDVDGDGDWECAENDNFECSRSIGEKQFASAQELYRQDGRALSGRIRSGLRFVDMSQITLTTTDTGEDHDVNTCTGAIGISMLAGSEEDGPGIGREGVSCSNGGLLVRGRCRAGRFACQGEKPVVLPTGTFGLQSWTPEVVPAQVFTIGSLAIIGVPAEMTSMAGHLLKTSLQAQLAPFGIDRVVIAAYANEYSNYVATRAEYQAQHYEGASTLFGEWTLAAYQKTFGELARAVASGTQVALGEVPVTSAAGLRTADQERGLDTTPRGSDYGSILSDAAASYRPGQTVSVEFQGSNPNNDMQLGRSFFEVQRSTGTGWETIAYDWDFNTRFRWEKTVARQSKVSVRWDVPANATAGSYRILVRGTALESRGDGGARAYEGLSRTFRVQ